MHSKDNRHDKEQLRETVAWRMIGFEARTCTIRICTGLSDDRIRRIYKRYLSAQPHCSIARHRGKSPRQPAHFMRNAAAQLESSTLASVLVSHGLLRLGKSRLLRENTVEYGAKFCDAYAEYCRFHRAARLSFEHAWFFRRALAAGTELYLERCKGCSGHYVSDLLSVDLRGCPLCRLQSRHFAHAKNGAAAATPPGAVLALPAAAIPSVVSRR